MKPSAHSERRLNQLAESASSIITLVRMAKNGHVVLEKMASGASNVAEAIGETRRAATIETFDSTVACRCAIRTRRRAQAPLLYYMEETASD